MKRTFTIHFATINTYI